MQRQSKLLVSLSIVVTAFAQTPPKDVVGWGKIRWGMTFAEVRSALSPSEMNEFPGQAASCSDYPIHYCAPDRGPYLESNEITEIGGIELHLMIQAAYKSTKVVSVQLADLNGKNAVENFDSLKTMLIQKYGPPANQETKIDDIGAHLKTALWTFPTTTILLTLREQATIFLDYKATDKKALEKL